MTEWNVVQRFTWMPWRRICHGPESVARRVFLAEIDSSVKAYPPGTETQLYEGTTRLVWHHVQTRKGRTV